MHPFHQLKQKKAKTAHQTGGKFTRKQKTCCRCSRVPFFPVVDFLILHFQRHFPYITTSYYRWDENAQLSTGRPNGKMRVQFILYIVFKAESNSQQKRYPSLNRVTWTQVDAAVPYWKFWRGPGLALRFRNALENMYGLLHTPIFMAHRCLQDFI